MKIIRVTVVIVAAFLTGCAVTPQRGQVPAENADAPLTEKLLVEKSIVETMQTREGEAADLAATRNSPAENLPEEKLPAVKPVISKTPAGEKPAHSSPHEDIHDGKTAGRKPLTRDVRPLSTNQELFLERNENNLLRVYVDMNKSRVVSIMSDHRADDWVNPCKEERLIDSNGRMYEVRFYLTRRPGKYRPLNEYLMTPVIFLNDRVYAIGRYGLKKLRVNSQLTDRRVYGCRSI